LGIRIAWRRRGIRILRLLIMRRIRSLALASVPFIMAGLLIRISAGRIVSTDNNNFYI
jgi:hypothetical protein